MFLRVFSIHMDATFSWVTVTKMTNFEVNGNCYCPGKFPDGYKSSL